MKLTRESVERAHTILRNLAVPGLPAPQLVPIGDGVRLEWHQCGINLEIEIGDKLGGFFEDIHEATAWEDEDLEDLAEVRAFAQELARRNLNSGNEQEQGA